MTTTIEKYNELQKKILSNFAIRWDGEKCKTTFRDDVKKFYGFEKEFGWNIILNSYYIIDDTELAKKSFKQFHLQGPSRQRVEYLNEALCFLSSSVLAESLVLLNPPHRQAEARYL